MQLLKCRSNLMLALQRGDRPMELVSLMARVTIRAVPTLTQDVDCARTLGERALVLARELGDQEAEAKILGSLSIANQWAGRWIEAIDCGERSLVLARKLDLREQMAQALNDLGSFSYLYTGHLDKAKASLSEASDLWRELDNLPMLADSLSSSAVAHMYAGEYDQALALSEEAFQISQSIGNLWGQSYGQWKVGFVLWDRGELSRAVSVMEECIRLGELAGFVPPQTHTRAELADLYGDLGAVSRGLETGRMALSVAETRQTSINRRKILGVLAHLHLLDGNLVEAEARIEEGRKDPYRDAWALLSVTTVLAEGELVLKQEDYERCVAVMDGLLTDLRRYGMRAHLPDALYLQGLALRGSGRDLAARECLQEARATAEAIGSRRTLWRILYALSQLESDPTEAERLHRGARQVVEYIADHVPTPELRTSFLSLPHVRAVLDG